MFVLPLFVAAVFVAAFKVIDDVVIISRWAQVTTAVRAATDFGYFFEILHLEKVQVVLRCIDELVLVHLLVSSCWWMMMHLRPWLLLLVVVIVERGGCNGSWSFLRRGHELLRGDLHRHDHSLRVQVHLLLAMRACVSWCSCDNRTTDLIIA